MKKLVLLAVALLGFGFANAQIKFGAKAGLNLSTLATSSYSTDAKVGFHIGGFAEIKIADKFALQPELLLSLQGGKTSSRYDYFFENYYSENTRDLLYLNLPVMAKFYVIEKLSVEAGPQVGFLLSAKQNIGNYYDYDNNDDYYSTRSSNVKGEYKGIDFGFNLGATYNFTKHIGASLRYTIGLADINDLPDGNDTKNNVLAASFNYTF